MTTRAEDGTVAMPMHHPDLRHHARDRIVAAEVMKLDLPEAERRARATARWEGNPGTTFEMTPGDHDRFRGIFQPPTEAEIAADHLPAPPAGHGSWLSWAADRWPSLPNFADERE